MADAPHGDDRHAPDPVRGTAPMAIGRTSRGPSRARPLASLCLTLGAILVAAVFVQWWDVYFSIGVPANAPTEAEANRYVVTAGACLLLLVVGTVAARRYVLTAFGMVPFVVGVAVAALFAVPSDRWEREPPPPPADRPICRSGGGSDDCPGG
ncbi:DUF6234 family protein [Cellulomonas shaoxiangyii]|uniref:DUF6234 domain-containing protein n=1 Tax=Cellulomonas shaoxiangyii TaxID=2566013 RepID=A0A4P7SP87_9CELL|nr:DUF6234 family protein [Cellulomonas shaoxiangyii]QCB94503.1 hypothetical protein E5225_14010 [Cellulomonas shaoxiangyii]TGY86085.1 hypothetical protein E5226_03735 [Cellulomonas shaoxiangyii]